MGIERALKMDINEKLNSMSMKEKLGQMFMARGMKLFKEETCQLIKDDIIGGIQAGVNDSKEEIQSAQEYCSLPMFVGADMEDGFYGGNFDGTKLGEQMGLGAIGSEETAYEFAARSAKEARAFGVNFVFGPVVDLANEPANPFVNIRSLGSDPETVVRLAAALIRGYQENGMIVSIKHYPGAGRAKVDSHIEPIVLNVSPDDFEKEELYIYRELIRRVELSGVMTGHIGVNFLDGNCPATLSSRITARLFDMGFSGLLITDSLAMKGIKGNLSPKDIFIKVLQAGHDILLGDYNLPPSEQLSYMLDAVKEGHISEKQVNHSVAKIFRAKEKILNSKPPLPDYSGNKKFAADFSRKAISITGNRSMLWNIIREKPLFIIAQEKAYDKIAEEISTGTADLSLKDTMGKRFPGSRILFISDEPGPMEIEETLNTAICYDNIVFIAYASIHCYKGTADFSKRLQALVSGLKNRIKIFITVGNPFAVREMPEFPCNVFAFDGSSSGMGPVLELLAGKTETSGILPVSLRYKSEE